MTVSNVVNGTMRGYNEQTRDRVLKAIEAAGYRPHLAARSLRSDKRLAVGMLVVQTGRRFLADPYITTLIDGLCAGLNQRGYSLVLQGLQPEEVGTSSLVQHLQTDGLCILTPGDFANSQPLRRLVEAMHQPVALFQQPPHDRLADICFLRQDDFDGGRALCSHLMARGAKKIVALVPELDWPAMQARVAGARQHVDDAKGAAALTVVTSTDESAAATQRALDAYLREGGTLDAVLAGNDQMAIAAYRLLSQRGLRIPEDVRLSGFNGLDFLDYFDAELTTVRSPAFELGQLGADHMVRRIESGSFDSPVVTLPTALQIGETS